MSSLQQRIASAIETRLSALAAIAAEAASLKVQLSELEGLREQVRNTQRSAPAS
jgi:hypothetical protein